MLQQPDKRWQEVLKAVNQEVLPSDLIVKRVLDVFTGKSTDKTVTYVIDKIQEPTDRDSIVAFILSGASAEEITTALWIPHPEAISLFMNLYLDTTVFRDKLDHLRYCEYYLKHVCAENDERNQALIRQGMSHGSKILSLWWQRANDVVTLDGADLTSKVLNVAYTNAIIAKDVSVTSATAREAHKWVKTALDTMSVRDNYSRDNDTDLDAVLAIQKHMGTKTPDDLGLKIEDIIH